MRGKCNAQAFLNAGDPVCGEAKLHLLLLARVRRMVSADRESGAVAQRLTTGGRVASGTQRRADAKIRIEGISGWSELFVSKVPACSADFLRNERHVGHRPTPPGPVSQMISMQRTQYCMVAPAGEVWHGSTATGDSSENSPQHTAHSVTCVATGIGIC